MTRIRAFAKRMDVEGGGLEVDARVVRDWAKAGRVYETAPRSFEIDVMLDSPAPRERVEALIAAAREGCFIEQTLGRADTIRHRLRTAEGFVER